MKNSIQLTKIIIPAALFFSLCAANVASATDETWNGNTDANWGTAANWSTATPVAGDDLFFGAAGSSGTILNNDITAGTSFLGITFNSGSSAYTLGGNSIVLTGGITNSSSSDQTINLNMANSANITVHGGSANMTLGGAITGTGALTNTGSGVLSLTNANGNTFSGGLTINTGTVYVGAGSSGNSSLGIGDVTVNAGGTLIATNGDGLGYNPSGGRNTPKNIYINGGTVTTLSGAGGAGGATYGVTMAANLFFTGGMLTNDPANTKSPNYTWNGSNITAFASSTTAIIGAGQLKFNNKGNTGGLITFNIASGTTPSGIDMLVSSVIINSGNAPILKIGAGLLELSGANAWTGALTNSAGTLLVSGSLASSSKLNIGPAVLCGTGTINGGVTNIDAGAQINQETNYLVTGTVGTLALGGNLNMNIGGSCSLDLSTSASGSNDKITVAGALSLNNNAFHIKALSGAANLDTTANYVLIQGSSAPSGTPNATPVWDGTPPANSSQFQVHVVGNNVVLQAIVNPVISSLTATPTTVTNGQKVLLTVTVTNGTPLYTVTVNASPIGASASVALALQGGGVTPGVGYVYTNTIIVVTNAPGVYSLPVNVVDSGSGAVSNNIPLTVAVYMTWNGDGSGNSFWDTSSVEWQNGLIYSSGDTVRFDNTATGINATNVNLQTVVSPGGIVVSNTAGTPTGTYTFIDASGSGADYISGTGGLLKQGSGTLQLNEGNDNFSGGITVGGGTLIYYLTYGTAAVSGGLTVTNGGNAILDESGTIAGGMTIGAGSSVQLGANDSGFGNIPSGTVTVNGTLIFNRQDDFTVSGAIGGASTGSLVQSNINNVTLSGASTFTGNVLVNSGTIADTKLGDGNSGGLGAAAAGKTITVNSGATLVIPQNVFGGNTVPEANMPAFIINGGTVNDITKYTAIGSVTLNNGATLTQSPSSVNSYQGYQFRGSITVGGSSPSTISTGNGADNHLDTNTVFNVADVTGDSGVDLTVSTGLRNASPDFGSVPSSLIKSGAGTMLLTANNSYTGNTVINAGTLALSGTASISSTPNIIVFGGATFDVSGLSSSFTLGSSQTLSNSTSTAVLNGSADASVGTVSLAYTSGTPSLNVASGTLTLTSGTTFKVNNTGSALSVGSYKIISKAGSGSVSGTAPSSVIVGGGGVSGTASLQITSGELYLVVTSVTPPTPRITSVSLSGTTLTITATNGADNGTYVLLESTNVALPLTNWVPVLTNTFDGSGNLNLSTNIVNPNNSQQFYILSQ